MEPSKLNGPICWYLGLAGGLGELMLWSGPWCGMSWLAGVFGTCVCNASAKRKIGFGGSSLEVEVCVVDCFADSAKVACSRVEPICDFDVGPCCCVLAPGTQKNL